MNKSPTNCIKYENHQCNANMKLEKNDPICQPCLDYEPKEEKKTDKYITDTIMEAHSFYCDRENPNLPLYVWTSGLWENHKSEAIILKDLSDMFKKEEHRSQMSIEKTTTFIKGIALTKKLKQQPPTLISFKNGLLNLKTMQLEPHNPEYFTINQIPHEYKPEAECPEWQKFLGEIIKEGDLQFLQEWIGYNLYTDTPEAAFLVLIGSGQNGKTILLEILSEILGENNTTTISLADLSYEEFAPAQLYHKLANISDDIGNTSIRHSGKLKEVSSGSRITAQRKMGQLFDFKPYSKITYSCNEPPEIKDDSDALKFRLKIIDFPYTFTKNPVGEERTAKDKKEIKITLQKEIPGIINWALIGLKIFLENNSSFTVNRSTDETWQYYQRKSKPVYMFVDEYLTMTDNEEDEVSIELMFDELKIWLKTNNIKLSVSRDKMLKDLKSLGITTSQRMKNDRKRMFYGVSLGKKEEQTKLDS